MLVAVARGGWIPTRFLSDALRVSRIASIGMSYQDAERTRLVAYSLPSIDEGRERILLIEDFLESGKSLAAARELLSPTAMEIHTAALFYSPTTIVIPDFSLGVLSSPPTFPWE